MMMLSFLIDGALAALAAGLLISGKYGITKQMSLAPLSVAVLDAAFAGKIQWGLTPAVSAILLGLQIVMLLGGAELLRQDHLRFRQKQERRARRRELARARAAFEAAWDEREARQQRSAGRVCA